MSVFKIGSVADWLPLSAGSGEFLELLVTDEEFRRCDFDFVSNSPVSVFVSCSEYQVLIAHGVGAFSAQFSVPSGFVLAVDGDPSAAVFYRSKVRSQLVAEGVDPSFTSIEPRRAGPSDDVRRMMLLMKINADRREEALRDEFNAAFAAREAAAVAVSAPLATGGADAVTE